MSLKTNIIKILLIIFCFNIFTKKCFAFWQIPEFLQKFVIFSSNYNIEKVNSYIYVYLKKGRKLNFFF